MRISTMRACFPKYSTADMYNTAIEFSATIYMVAEAILVRYLIFPLKMILRVDFYHIQSFTCLFDPRMIRGTADLQYCTDLQYLTYLRNFTYAVESECMACLQASRRGELRELAGFVHVKGEIS